MNDEYRKRKKKLGNESECSKDGLYRQKKTKV